MALLLEANETQTGQGPPCCIVVDEDTPLVGINETRLVSAFTSSSGWANEQQMAILLQTQRLLTPTSSTFFEGPFSCVGFVFHSNVLQNGRHQNGGYCWLALNQSAQRTVERTDPFVVSPNDIGFWEPLFRRVSAREFHPLTVA